ncbi:transcriptional regulator, TetR family [Catenulispora acidiphila DSM 44928]|uniref:Transcriptional regulator, TetR family n=1 Tax=Catenulispora acidiphila (strain DSM 44928 / JCM 14897 / NBRC 102108 / NRRL B-24433 / ID139908) TaxID=479433 RepID=C7Q8Q6_CATAD|nr:TetR family transcriptional regulator [Catenulispora acidiphila]ACU70321.1 transcriptional regulator, TetR family [Catenulispora acidiphila DSM 44928]
MGSAREALLDAAYETIVAGLWSSARMADLAARAGVSRQTLYNEFGNRDQLAAALALREAERFRELTGHAARTAPGDIGAATAASVTAALTAARDNPLIKATLTDDTSGLLPYLTTRSAAIMDVFREDSIAVFTERWPELAERPEVRAEVGWICETAFRLVISHLIIATEPVQTTSAHIAEVVRRLMRDLTTNE